MVAIFTRHKRCMKPPSTPNNTPRFIKVLMYEIGKRQITSSHLLASIILTATKVETENLKFNNKLELSVTTNMQRVGMYRNLLSVNTTYSSKYVGVAASNTQALSIAAVVTGAFVLIFDVVECTLGAIIELVEWLVVVLVALRIGVGEAGLAFKLRNAAGGGQETLVIVIFGVECIKRAAALLGVGLPFINLVLTVLLRRVFCKKPLTFCNSDSLRFAMLLIKARAVEELTVNIVCLT
uniref:Uncharacterized protein n=1 Tax=Glossina palpalis gambiensis TaxID=67801 RepID=A0A1B0BD48_9MUSC